MKTKMKFLFTSMAILILLVGITGVAFAATWTDKPDYYPGSVVTISGDNSDRAGYAAGETVHVDVLGPNGFTAACDATTDDYGAWSCQVTLNGDASAIGVYSYTATGQDSGVFQSGTFTDDPVAIFTSDSTCLARTGSSVKNPSTPKWIRRRIMSGWLTV